MVGAALLAGWLSLDLDHAHQQLQRLQGNPRERENPLFLTLKQATSQIRRAYSRHPVFPARANCLAVPELTIMPKKRFWSGDLTENRVLEIVSRERPDALVLRVEGELADPAWRALVERDYTHTLTDWGLALYLRRTNGITPHRSLGERLRDLGL
jgi:hypothetical protein